MHKISAKIRAAEAQSLLECDFEYISIVYRMLPEVQKEKWISIAPSNPKWDSFYRFLEEVYQRALLKKQIGETCKQGGVESNNKGNFCSLCKKPGHVRENCVQNLVKGNIFAATNGNKICPLCESNHPITIKTSDGYNVSVMGTRLLNCSQFRDATDSKKGSYF